MSSKEPVLLLKTKSGPTDAYEELFSAPRDDGLDLEPIFVPVLQHQFDADGVAKLRKLLREKRIGNGQDAAYGGLIFTSQRAVEAFAKVVDEGPDEQDTDCPSWPHLQQTPLYSVGPATTRALCAIPQNPPLQIFGSHTGNGEALAPFIQEHYSVWFSSLSKPPPPLLFLVGDKRRDVIPATLMDPALPSERRIQVDEVVVYGTGVMESFPGDFGEVLGRTERKGGRRWVVVFSPTGCEGMLKGLGLLDPATGRVWDEIDERGRTDFVVTIGPTTYAHLRDRFGFEADVCAEVPSPEGVLEGMRRFVRDRGTG